MLTLFVTILWGHLTALVYLDTLEMGQRVLVSINFRSFIVIRGWSGKAYLCKVVGDCLKPEVTMLSWGGGGVLQGFHQPGPQDVYRETPWAPWGQGWF